ncbi:TonB-dependent receptor domain-containing protein [Oleiharenicola lentus]|uniref:TonB-dependent receptor domain-containing protein n=1 Tax=Oleiharenicola lentus TaxID=2508720 RepID=UPI003F679DBA
MSSHNRLSIRLLEKISRAFSVLAVVVATFAAGLSVHAQQAAATGTVVGRVFNASTNSALRNASVSFEGSAKTVLTESDGSYVLDDVPAGDAKIRVSYVGLSSTTATVTVAAGGRAERDFDLRVGDSSRIEVETDSKTVELEKFTVVADQEMSAQAIAMNERRSAPNIKQVVAYDEYGDRASENIGEFLRYLPGVGIEDSGQQASTVTLRGFPSANTNIQVDGADIAGARGNSRAQSLLDVPMGNIERVEISKSGMPDLPAAGMGGSINLVTKGAFSAKRPVFNYRTYFLIDSKSSFDFDAGPRGLSDKLSPNYKQPSFDFSYILPINKKFGITVGASRTWRIKPMESGDNTDTNADWNYTTGAFRQATWFTLDQIFQTWNAQFGADWKISNRSQLSFSFQQRGVSSNIMRESVVINFAAGATGDPTFVQGAATGVGVVQYAAGPNQETGSDTSHATLKFSHKERDWRLDALAAYSFSTSFLDDIDNGHFNDAPSNFSGLVIRGEGIGEDEATIPVRYSATRAGVPVNIFDAGNVTIGNPTSAQNHIYAEKFTGRADFTRTFNGRFPVTLKTGVFGERLNRDTDSDAINYTFTPNGLTTAAAKQASLFPVFDEEFLATNPTVFGAPIRYLSVRKLYELYQANPSWFPINQATTHNTRATGSREITETVSAAYLRADAHFFDRRLWFIGGVRFEKTTDDGFGVLTDPTAIYLRDAAGNFVPGSAPGGRTLISTDPLVQAQLTNVRKGAHVKKSYDDFYPSANLTYLITEKLLARAAYYVTIGRPNLNFITPGVTITDSTSATPSITVNNTALKPQEATSYEFSLESYQIKGGIGSIGVFQKDIKDFFGQITQDATPELLEFYNLPAELLQLNPNYDIITRINAGDAKVTGFEFSYKQSLFFLPNFMRGISVFGNATKLELSGSNTADFTGFVPETFSGGIELIRPRFYVKLNVTYQGETRGALQAVSTANGIPAGTYAYQGERTRVSLSASYSFSKKFAVYGSISDINGRYDVLTRLYPDGAPEYVKDRRRQELGAIINVGVKGTF